MQSHLNIEVVAVSIVAFFLLLFTNLGYASDLDKGFSRTVYELEALHSSPNSSKVSSSRYSRSFNRGSRFFRGGRSFNRSNRFFRGGRSFNRSNRYYRGGRSYYHSNRYYGNRFNRRYGY